MFSRLTKSSGAMKRLVPFGLEELPEMDPSALRENPKSQRRAWPRDTSTLAYPDM